MSRILRKENKNLYKYLNAKKELGSHFSNLWENNVNFKERVLYLNADVDEHALALVLKALDEMEINKPEEPIRLEISSYGGSVYDMLGIIGRIKMSPCHIITRAFGKVMSAATFILAAGDERHMDAYSYFMMHEMYDETAATVTDMNVEIAHMNQLQTHLYKIYEEFSKYTIPAKQFSRMCKRNTYLTPQEVLNLGLIDHITNSKKD